MGRVEWKASLQRSALPRPGRALRCRGSRRPLAHAAARPFDGNKMSGDDSHYADDFVDRLETLWGEGFLSPGGAAEVAAIVEGIDLAGKSILDIGCGTGGVEVALVRDLGAGRVTAIDVEAKMIDRTRKLLTAAGIGDQVDVRLVEPGSLPFPDASFDLVFSKDSMVHIPGKDALFRDVLRVLRPGGVFTASDWLVGASADTSRAWARFRELAHLDFHFATARETAQTMGRAGFQDVSTVDRNAWYAALVEDEVRRLEGPLRERIIELSDEATYASWMAVRRALRDSAKDGALRPTHLRGFKAAG